MLLRVLRILQKTIEQVHAGNCKDDGIPIYISIPAGLAGISALVITRKRE